ncbi:MAG: tRNA-dihydrouridine synthase [Bdellovibrionales bacterium]|nr:tRNA-dihydrouridine synthase [Bdellovibrionales bacterium]
MPPSSVVIRDIKISPALILAPMSGVTNVAFRRLIKQLNPGALGLVVTEFVSVEGLTRDSRRTLEMLDYYEEERPLAMQIFGYDLARMRDGAKLVQDLGADIIDINCGCPAPKVVKKGGGCELMRQPQHLARILKSVRAAVSIPLTMKMRSGWDESNLNALEIGKIAVGEGVEALAVHGRSRAQLYRGSADWDIVKQLADELPIPILGSGDVVDCTSAAERFASGAAGLLIGRGAIFNPLVFSEIQQQLSPRLPKCPALMLEVLERYMLLLQEDFEPRRCVGRVKQLASQMCKGQRWARDLCRLNAFEEQVAYVRNLRDFFEIQEDSTDLLRAECYK